VSGLAAREPGRGCLPDGRGGMRVVSWNLWWRYGRWQERREAIVAELRRVRPDVCGLQEVWADPDENLAAYIADKLGMYHAYAPSPAPGKWQRKIGDASVGIGNAVLSRWPISESDVGRLPAGDEPDEGRVVLYARIDTPYGNVPCFVTHLNAACGQSELRQEQVVAVAEFMRQKGQDGYPPILTGDLNAPPDADEVRCLVGKAPPPLRGFVLVDAWAYARPLLPGWTWDRRNPHVAATFEPDARIDYVFVGLPGSCGRGQVLDVELVGTERRDSVWPSDHFGVLALLRGDALERETNDHPEGSDQTDP
jgi:endonuclease/exonuclease/phosphatase family metal-dependent hydrolase